LGPIQKTDEKNETKENNSFLERPDGPGTQNFIRNKNLEKLD
jgi:hypothetical protein